MTPTKLLLGQILVVFAIVIAGVWSATQWAAAMLGYQAQLGAPWVLLFGFPVYRPWQLFPWWYAYDAYAPHVFNKAGMLAGASGFMGVRRRHHRLPVAGAADPADHHLRLVALGDQAGDRRRRVVPDGRSVPRAAGQSLFAP